MCELIINGGKHLYGDVEIQGSKNASLPILAASIMTDKECFIHNCPKISDVYAAFDIIAELGGKAEFEGGSAVVCGSNVSGVEIPDALMRKMRSSLMFLGPLLAKNGEAVICNPGGCKLGKRPIDIHISAMRKLGVTFCERGECIFCSVDKLRSGRLTLLYPSVGATENIMMLCAGGNVDVSIINPAREPEIVDLQNFLNKMGADIGGAGGDVIRIRPASELHGCEHEIMPDRIVASTYAFMTAMCGGDVLLKRSESEHMGIVSALLEEMGCGISVHDGEVRVVSQGRLNAVREVKTLPYPGFPTDVQPMLTVASSIALGDTTICETVFESRFAYADELIKMGADITKEAYIMRVRGVDRLTGRRVTAPDLRGGAALVAAGLTAFGQTNVAGLEYIERGYENIETDLKKIGADIRII